MDTQTAIEICEKWFAHLQRQADDAETLQQASRLARRGETLAAQRLKSSVDRQPKVFDGSTLEPAVRHLCELATKNP